jgi:hypothetical protein
MGVLKLPVGDTCCGLLWQTLLVWQESDFAGETVFVLSEPIEILQIVDHQQFCVLRVIMLFWIRSKLSP